MNKRVGNYFDSSAPPEEAINNTKRSIKLRFKTKEDVDLFFKQTGIQLQYTKNTFLSYPIETVNLENFS